MKYLVSYSGGIGSFWATKILVDKYGKENVVAIFCDVNWEDEDLYEFVKNTINHLGIELIYLKAPMNPLELSQKENVIYNSRMASCSKILKMRLQYSFILKRNYKVLGNIYNLQELCLSGYEYFNRLNNKDFTIALGIDWTETHRTEAIVKNWNKHNYNVIFPLIDDLDYSKQKAFKYLSKNNIAIPRMYEMGFSHNNCGGRCFKGGQGHFKILYDKFPNRFLELEKFENDFRKKTNKEHTILKKQINSITKRYPLEQLRNDIINKPEQIDLFDIGTCGCFLE